MYMRGPPGLQSSSACVQICMHTLVISNGVLGCAGGVVTRGVWRVPCNADVTPGMCCALQPGSSAGIQQVGGVCTDSPARRAKGLAGCCPRRCTCSGDSGSAPAGGQGTAQQGRQVLCWCQHAPEPGLSSQIDWKAAAPTEWHHSTLFSSQLYAQALAKRHQALHALTTHVFVVSCHRAVCCRVGSHARRAQQSGRHGCWRGVTPERCTAGHGDAEGRACSQAQRVSAIHNAWHFAECPRIIIMWLYVP